MARAKVIARPGQQVGGPGRFRVDALGRFANGAAQAVDEARGLAFDRAADIVETDGQRLVHGAETLFDPGRAARDAGRDAVGGGLAGTVEFVGAARQRVGNACGGSFAGAVQFGCVAAENVGDTGCCRIADAAQFVGPTGKRVGDARRSDAAHLIEIGYAGRERIADPVAGIFDELVDGPDAVADAALKNTEAVFDPAAGVFQADIDAGGGNIHAVRQRVGGAADLVSRVAQAAGDQAGAVAHALVQHIGAAIDGRAELALALLQCHFQHAGAGCERCRDGGRFFLENLGQLAAAFVDGKVDGVDPIVERRADAVVGGRKRPRQLFGATRQCLFDFGGLAGHGGGDLRRMAGEGTGNICRVARHRAGDLADATAQIVGNVGDAAGELLLDVADAIRHGFGNHGGAERQVVRDFFSAARQCVRHVCGTCRHGACDIRIALGQHAVQRCGAGRQVVRQGLRAVGQDAANPFHGPADGGFDGRGA